ncbi:MAG TPA: TraB/GumN family protein [Rhodanobacteraceae bacterium]
MISTTFRRTLLASGMTLVVGLAGLAPAAFARATTPTVNHTHPALWEAHDSNTTIYFFGGVHALKKGIHWRFPALNKALAASQTLYLEAANLNQATVRPLVMRYGIDRKHALSADLKPKEQKLLQAAVKQLGMPGGMKAINMMKPWLAAISISMAPIFKAGYDPKLGVYEQLQQQFKQEGKSVKGFETAKEQMLFLAKLPQPVQMDLLRKSLHDYALADTQLTQIVDAWQHGRVQTLDKMMVKQMFDRSPKLYKVLLINRNKNWSHQIAKLMHTDTGTIFVAVGAGHLAGPDRLQVQLRKLGIQTTRIPQ